MAFCKIFKQLEKVGKKPNSFCQRWTFVLAKPSKLLFGMLLGVIFSNKKFSWVVEK